MIKKEVSPLGNRVVVKPILIKEERTKSGIILEAQPQEMPMQGTVIAIGPTVEGIKPGDTVLFPKFAGDDVEFEMGVPMKVMWVDSILGILKYVDDGKLPDAPKELPAKKRTDKKSANRKA